MHKTKNKLMPAIITFIAIIGIWEMLDYILQIKEIILPNPHEILNALIQNFPEILKHTSITGTEAILGFILGSTISFLIAVSFVYSKKTKSAFYPYVIVIQAIPILALAPLIILWCGNGMSSKIVMAALVAFFPVLVNSFKGLTNIEKEEHELLKTLSATKNQIFWKLRLQNSLSYLFPALKIGITAAIIGATISEFTGSSAGIGNLIVQSSYYLETSLLFAALISISILGVILFYIINWIEKRIVFWEEEK